MDEYVSLEQNDRTPPLQAGGNLTPINKTDFGWFTVLQYPRGKRTYIIEGTEISISPQTYKVLERLVAHGSQSLLPSSELRKLFSHSPYAKVLLSKALGELEQIFTDMHPTLASRILERNGRAGTRLFMPADLHLAVPPAPQIKVEDKMPIKPRANAPMKQIAAKPVNTPVLPPALPPAKRAFKAANLTSVATKDMKLNGLYLDPASDGWFIFAGETDTSAMEQETSEDAPRVSMRRLASIRLDGEEAGHLAFDAPTALKVDAVSAYLTLRSAHHRMIELLKAAPLLAALYQTPRHPVRLAEDINSGDPARVASALAQATIYLRAPVDPYDFYADFMRVPYQVLHRRALAILTRYNALVNDVPFEQALRPLAKALSVDADVATPQFQNLYPYQRPTSAHQPIYNALRHGAAQKPKLIHRYGWVTIEEYDRHFGRYRLAGDTATLRPDAFRLLKILHRHRGEFVSREALHSALYPDAANPEAALNNALAVLRETLTPIFKQQGKTAEEIILTGRGQGLRLMMPGETWVKPVAEAKKQPELEFTPHTLGNFSVGIADGVRRMGIRIATSNRYLSPVEFAYLEHLYQRAGQWVTRRESAEELFPDSPHGEARVATLIDGVGNKLIDVFSKDRTSAMFGVARGAGCCLAAEGEALPPLPAGAESAAAGRITETRDYGHFKVVVIADALHNPAHFEGTGISLSWKELALLDFLHEYAGTWVTPAQITRHLYGERENAHAQAFGIVESFVEKLEEALGTKECAAIFGRVPRLGMALAKPGAGVPPLPPRVHVRFAEKVQASAGDGEAVLYYHSGYGPGYDLGDETRNVMGVDMTFRRFLPLIEKDPRDQAEVLLARGAGLKGYGVMDMTAYRSALRAGIAELRQCVESGVYEGPSIKDINVALKGSKSPAVIIPLLGSFLFHLPTSKDGSGPMRTQIERMVGRSVTLAFPHVTMAQVQHHVDFLQAWPRKLSADLVFPFESPDMFAKAAAQIETMIAGQQVNRKKAASLNDRFTPAAGHKRITGNSEPTFDAATFAERRLRLHPSLIVA